MDAGVVGEFGVEGGGHGLSLPNGDGIVSPSVAMTSTPSPTCSILGARMKTISRGESLGPNSLPSRMELSIWRP